jgi:phytoene dehydrogenase-like protein
VVGSGPNGLAAAIRLAEQGLSVKVFEASDTIGGGMRTKELMQPGFRHDVCSAIHPLAASSPYLKHLPLEKHGLEWITPEFPVAHPMDDGTAVVMHHNISQTVEELGVDGSSYRSAMEPIADNWDTLTSDFLGPLRFPKHPIDLALFGLKALQPASLFQRRFKDERAKALFAGLVAHSILPLNAISTSAIGDNLLLIIDTFSATTSRANTSLC